MNTTRPILFHNTMPISEGRLEPFKDAIRQAVTFVEEHGPQLMVEVFVDGEEMLAHSFQLYADSAAIRTHWAISDPYIEQVMEHCRVERFAVFGDPDEAVMEGLRAFASSSAVPITVTPSFFGFTRPATPGR